jgi:hypothetical protein
LDWQCVKGWETAGSKVVAYPGVDPCGSKFCCVRQTLAWMGTKTKVGGVCDVSVDGLATYGLCLGEAACLAKSADAVLFDGLAGPCAACCVVSSIPIPRTSKDPVVETWQLPAPCIIGRSAGACMTETACLAQPNGFSYEYGGCVDETHRCCTPGEAVEDDTLFVNGVAVNPADRDPLDCARNGVAGVCLTQALCAAGRTAWALGAAGVDQGCASLPAGSNFCCVENGPEAPRPGAPTPKPTPKPTPRVVTPPAPGAPAPRIRVPSVPTRTCNLVSPVCSDMFNACGNNVVFDEEFMPVIAEHNRCARASGTKIGICSTYRNIAHNRRVGGASGSNHLVGHAIDFNIKDRSGVVCNERCLLSKATREARPGVKETLACIERIPTNAWGGNPVHRINIRGHLDVVHCDDRINVRYPTAHVAKRTACDADRVFQRVSCDSYALNAQSLLEDGAADDGASEFVASPADADEAPVGVIVGAAVGGAVLVLVIVAVVVYLAVVRKRTQFNVG